MISIVIPLYNKEGQIANTLRTVLAQTYKDFEIVIVNDGSTDRSVDEVAKFTDPRIRLINQQNAGVSAARNRGIMEAKGEYIALLDADDEWKPDYLETQMTLAKKYPEASVFAVNYEFRDTSGKVTPTIIRNIRFDGDCGIMDNYFEVATTSHPPICSISIMARKGAFESVGGFPIGIKSGEDLLTWAKLAVKYRIAYSRKICATYNLGEGYDFANLPPRRQDIGDPVGRALSGLYESHRDMYGLRKYISHWHKMRASVSLRYGERRETFSEVFKSLGYNPFNYKVMPFLVLAALPASIRNKIISNYKS